MTFLPVLPLWLLVPIALAAVVFVVWSLVRAESGERVAWGIRIGLVVACGLLALRPGIPSGSANAVVTDLDVLIVVDSTTSITAEDWGESSPRLEGVRADVEHIIDAYPGARFSLVTFDNHATQRLPLTTDVDAVFSSLEVLRPPTTSYARGSDIAEAAPLVAEVAERAANRDPDRSRIVFYFGDGEQTAEGEPGSFADAAGAVDGGAVYGYGTADGGRMRVVDGFDGVTEYLTYEGADALSMIDEDNLRTVAEELGVPYEHRTAASAPTVPDPPPVATQAAEANSFGARTELSWAVALVVGALALIDLGRAVRLLRRTAALPQTGGAP